MVKSLKDSDLPEPWFGSKSKASPAQKRPRVTPEVIPETQALEDGDVLEKREGARKPKKKPNPIAKGKNNVKYDRTGQTDVVVGRTKNPVADPDELRRKRAEDAAACGRVVKTIPNRAKKRSSTTIVDTESSDQSSQDGLAPLEKETGLRSPSAVEANAVSGGKRTESHGEKCIVVGHVPNLSNCR